MSTALAQAVPIPKRWEVAAADPALVNALATQAAVDPLLAHILVARGVTDPERARAFLNPRLADLTPPDAMADLDRAAARIVRAVKGGEPIAVFGDFDVDGVTSVALLSTFFRWIGVEVRTYIPVRLEEGYGLNPRAIELLAGEGRRVLITVDCGISDNEAVARAQELGMDVIVTDHHRVGHGLPPAHAVVNPNRPDCAFPFKHLAGVGLAFYLAAAVRSRLEREGMLAREKMPDLRELLDLVALGTVADIAELSGDNRILTHYGLALLSDERRIGIRALKEVARIGKRPVRSGTIGYQLGPRINAAGRLGDSSMAVRLLTTDSVAEALTIAHELEKANRERQQLERAILDEARGMIAARPRMAERTSIVLASERWHPGVVGIVASKIVEEFNRPTILIALRGERGRGSARSIPGYNIHTGIAACADLLLDFGGHRAAAGLELERRHLAEFVRAFEEETKKSLADTDTRPVLRVDLVVDLARVDLDLVETLGRLAPFGYGNPEPVLMTRGVRVAQKRPVGGRHLKLALEQGGAARDALWFQRADLLHAIPPEVDVVYRVETDSFSGTPCAVLHLLDLRPAGAPEPPAGG